ncbi:hypothetical protein GC209_13615 [bacterium]|nr:hypothetical protein [bacterium]
MRIQFRCDPALIDRLPRPVPARDGLPDWLRRMPAEALSPAHGTTVRTVKQCPPFVDAMSHGFLMTLPCDVTVAGGRFSWSWDLAPLTVEMHPRAPLSFHVAEQLSGAPLDTGGRVAIKFNSFWTIRLDPGYSIFATHPVNRPDLPFRTLSGLVDSDRFHQVGVLFPAIWEDAEFEGVLPAGTPVAQCFPVERAALDLDCAVFSDEEARDYDRTARDLLDAPGVYRKRYRGKRPSSQR